MDSLGGFRIQNVKKTDNPGTTDQGGGGEQEEEEGAPCRSSAFVPAMAQKVEFKATESAGIDLDGLFLDLGDFTNPFAFLTSGMDSGILDLVANQLSITALAIERDAFRNGWLAVNAGFEGVIDDEEPGWRAGAAHRALPDRSDLSNQWGAEPHCATEKAPDNRGPFLNRLPVDQPPSPQQLFQLHRQQHQQRQAETDQQLVRVQGLGLENAIQYW